MQKKRGVFWALLFFLLIAIVHSVLHVYVWGLGIPGFFDKGISGFSVGKFSIGEEQTGGYSLDVSLSQILVIVEWFFVLAFFIFMHTRNRISSKKEFNDLQISKNKNLSSSNKNSPSKNKTDLDVLYDLLQSKKRISFAAIIKTFNVDEKTAMNWAKILEVGNLATISYPRVGSPELVLIEKTEEVKKNEKK